MIYPFPVTVTFQGTVELPDPKGNLTIRHFSTDGQSLSSIFPDVVKEMEKDKSYPVPVPTNSSYTYQGYKETTNGSPPAGGSIIPGNRHDIAYNGSYTQHYVYLYYSRNTPTLTQGEVNVRHMVREGPNGTYQEKARTVTIVDLDYSDTIRPAASYGTQKGRNIGYTGFSDTVASGTSISVSLDKARPKAYVTFFYEVAAGQGPKEFSGDFDVVPGTIEYREEFSFRPKNFVMNGCTYTSHQYKIERNGQTWTSHQVQGSTNVSNFNKNNYPSVLGVGTHMVSMKITASCGTSEWIGPKPLVVTSIRDNRPPDFEIGFVYPFQPTEPLTTVVQGSTLDLIYIEDPTVPTPHDPDGDNFTFNGFDFVGTTSAWLKTIPVKYQHQSYTNGYHSISMDTLGYHTISATMTDDFGASATRSTTIHVVRQEPVPIITGSQTVIEGRPLKEPLSSKNSITYMPGRTINHSRDLWTNLKTKYDTPGKERITLHVFDSAGLQSLEPAVHELTVLEDQPPVPALDYQTPSIRGNQTFKLVSYTTDGDEIVEERVHYAYDSNNNGNFKDEQLVEVKIGADRSFELKNLKVGRYKFTVFAKEDWGLEATKDFYLNVINDKPLVSFDISSESIEPAVITSIPLRAADIVSSNNWKNYDSLGQKPKSWGANPQTKALGHSPYVQFNDQHLQYHYIGPTKEGLNVLEFPHNDYHYSNGESSKYFHLRYQNKDYFLYEGYTPGQDGYSSQYYTTIRENGETPKRLYYRETASQSWYTTIDYMITGINQENETVGFFNYPITTRFTFDELVRKEVAVPNFFYNYYSSTPYPSPYHPYNTPWGYMASPSEGATTLSTYEWSSPKGAAITRPLNGSYRDIASFNKVDATLRHHTFSNEYNAKYTIYDVSKNTKITVPNIPYGYYTSGTYGSYLSYNYSPSSSGDFALQTRSEAGSAINVYSTKTGALVDTIENRFYKFPPVRDHLILFDLNGDKAGTNMYGYHWGSDGKFTQKYSVPNVYYTPGGNNAGAVDGAGYMYYIDKTSTSIAVKRFPIETGVPELVLDLTNYMPSYTGEYSFQYNQEGNILLRFMYKERPDSTTTAVKQWILRNLKPDPKRLVAEQVLLNNQEFQAVTINYSLRLNPEGYLSTRYAGFAFNAEDERNMYRVESNIDTLRLVKIRNGNRIIMEEKPYAFGHTLHKFKIQVLDGNILVYVNGVPLIDVNDSEYEKGFFGPYSGALRAEFLNMAYSDLSALSASSKLDGIAIVGESMIYSTTYNDSENDPTIRELTEWTYAQTEPNKFLDAGDGKSGRSTHHEKTYTAPVEAMDKVGVYQVTYNTTDDPHPDHRYPDDTFAIYRQTSNTPSRTLIVHRAPTVDYDIALAPDYTVRWTDRSHDKDRWLSATNYSREDTGIDYQLTKGILEKKFYYKTPSGLTIDQKLVIPEERGLYTVGMAVKDEYDAWSPFLERTINITQLPSDNEPPVAGFTATPGTSYRGVAIRINSTASDKEDGGRQNLPHWYYIRNLTDGGYETLQSTVRTSWNKTFSSMGTFQIRQVVEDSLGQTDQAIRTVQIVNRPPTVSLMTTLSQDQAKPTKVTTATPTFTWTYTDADGDPQARYQLRVYRYGGVLERDSDVKASASKSWTPGDLLPERVNLYVQARVYDGYDWSEWGTPRFFYIETNQPPTADFDWSPKPVYEGDTLRLLDRSSDPDGDPLTYQWRVIQPGGTITTFAVAEPTLSTTVPGDYRVTLTVSDGKAQAEATKAITVLPLGLSAELHHMPDWLDKHIQAGHETAAAPKDFYAGEILVVQAETSPAPVRRVTATLDVRGADGGRLLVSTVLASNGERRYAAELYDERWGSFDSGLPKGLHRVHFDVEYANGVVKTAEVPFRIIGHVLESVGVHRRQ
ncbi:hypothetical protein PA598K_05880 [Paenibacillus sp. 598K]|uniref:glycoside hydrolase family 78 protein n=1 Tax=Paenibacillus sp. 598K TaxID=1117987 RepID=UPI000FF94E06|nr:PKD domain-containing protein [Paenibacillus sp. 598K]GBF77336.1 hypothetical protein PA598K_05880 [Paenibacillus sp. 598K]